MRQIIRQGLDRHNESIKHHHFVEWFCILHSLCGKLRTEMRDIEHILDLTHLVGYRRFCCSKELLDPPGCDLRFR
jgi:hypothetical protein